MLLFIVFFHHQKQQGLQIIFKVNHQKEKKNIISIYTRKCKNNWNDMAFALENKIINHQSNDIRYHQENNNNNNNTKKEENTNNKQCRKRINNIKNVINSTKEENKRNHH